MKLQKIDNIQKSKDILKNKDKKRKYKKRKYKKKKKKNRKDSSSDTSSSKLTHPHNNGNVSPLSQL